MVVNIENLIKALSIKGDQSKTDALSHMVLEAIASDKDNIIMTDLMIEMLQRNALLNRQLENKILEVERLSVTDQLTGAFNRRKFINVLENEMDRMVRYDRVFSLIMFDIDHFKNVNDTYGHDVGDFVLRDISKNSMDRLRVSDTFARWGGEEFMILAPETNLEDGIKLAEILRKSIEEYNFSPVPRITSSFGIVCSSEEALESIDDLTKAVDEALYYAKRSGRNKVVSYNDIKSEIETDSNNEHSEDVTTEHN